jgi:serine protease inhibitor
MMKERISTSTHAHTRRNRIIAAAIAAVLVVGAGVWWTTGGESVARNMLKPLAKPASAKIIDSTSDFAYRTAPQFLAMKAGDANGNVNYSPASMWTALAIAAQGANGATRTQMEDLLGSVSLTGDDYQSLMSSINGRYAKAKSEMSADNSLWIDDGYAFQDDYANTVKQSFDADLKTLDFGDKEKTGRSMSSWIAKHTRDMLKPKITISDKEILSIINTVYANGLWKDPFKKDFTSDQTFHGVSGADDAPDLQIDGLCA